MKKLRLVLAFLAAGAVMNFSSCSKDDDNTNNTPTTPTATTNEASIDGVTVTKTADPVMSDKIAVLETTAGKFETYFAEKPTESGTYTVKSAFTAAKGLADLKEVILVFTDKVSQNMYTSNTSGTASIVIKDGKISIDIKNVDVCTGSTCKKVSVKYDFSYTPPTVDPVDPIDPVDPNPSAEAYGTGIIDGVKSIDTKYNSTGTFLSVINQHNANLTVDGGSFSVRFKERPTKSGTYKITLDSPSTPLADNEAVFSYVPPTITDFANYYTSGVNSTGSVTVKISGNKLIVEAVNIVAFKNSDKSVSKTFSAYMSINN